MSEYEVGYGKPPRKSRFKPGTSGNPRGRPRGRPNTVAETIRGTLEELAEYRDKGQVKATTYVELILKRSIDAAINGSVEDAEYILRARAHAQQHGDAGVDRLRVDGWLPDYPGQTAEQKTSDFEGSRDAEPDGWWPEPADKNGQAPTE